MKVVLGYSGGLDTSIIVPWLKEKYDAEVICMAADVGQRDDLSALDKKAKASGASALVVEDLKKEFVEQFAWPTLRAGAVYIPVHARAIARETAQMVDLAEAKALIVPAGLAANAIAADAQCATLRHIIVCSEADGIPSHAPARARWHDYDALARTHAGETLALEVALELAFAGQIRLRPVSSGLGRTLFSHWLVASAFDEAAIRSRCVRVRVAEVTS